MTVANDQQLWSEMETIQKRWITYRQAENLTGISRSKLWQLIASGEVEASKVGKGVRIDKASLETYMTEHPAGLVKDAARK